MTLIQQQRLLGAVLLVCLIGVIAWFLLDKVEQNQPAKPQQEPIAFDSVIEPIPEDIEVVEPAEEAMVDPQGLSQQDAGTDSKPIDEKQHATDGSIESETMSASETEPAPDLTTAQEQKPEPESEPQPIAKSQKEAPRQDQSQPDAVEPQWVLQLASFSVRENADALSTQLKQMGYDPMIETISSAGTLIYRVRLQPVTDRIKLQQTAETLSNKLKLNAQILQHNP